MTDSGSLERPRITRALRHAASLGIGLLVAGPGCGKTEALQCAFPPTQGATHVALDERTTSVGALLRLLVERTLPQHRRTFTALIAKAGSPEAVGDTVIPWIVARLRPRQHPIILDDLHLVGSDPHGGNALRQLIEATHDAFPWLLASREMPPLPIGTWIAGNRMPLPITDTDLAFHADEAQRLAARMQVAIPPGAVDEILHATQGWPIAVRLALSSWDGRSPNVPDDLRAQDALARYVDEQIWQRLSERERALLQALVQLRQPRLAILTAAGFTAAPADFAPLQRRISFIQEEREGVIRIHATFRDFVLARAAADPTTPDTLARLAAALTTIGHPSDALDLHVRLKDQPAILRTLESAGADLIENGYRQDVSTALTALAPPASEHPVAKGLRGQIQLLDGAFTSAEADIRQALKGKPPAPFAQHLGRLLAAFYLNRDRAAEAYQTIVDILADVHVDAGDAGDAVELRAELAIAAATLDRTEEALAHAHFALTHLGDIPVERRPNVLFRAAGAHYLSEDFSRSETIALEAVALAEELTLEGLTARIYSLLYAIASTTYLDPTKSWQYTRAMANAAQNAGDRGLRLAALERLYALAIEDADDDTIEAIERELVELGQIRLVRDTMFARYGRVIHLVGKQQHRDATNILRTTDLRELSAAEVALHSSLLVLCAIAQNDRETALAMLDKPFVVDVEPNRVSQHLLLMARSFRALALWLVGRQAIARRSLDRNLPSFLSERDRILVTTIASLCASTRTAVTEQVIDQMTAPLVAIRMNGHARFLRQVANVPVHATPLTPAEVALLRAWRPSDTVYELADRLGKSRLTINNQMAAIYRKTGTNGRAEALAYAQAHGIIDR